MVIPVYGLLRRIVLYKFCLWSIITTLWKQVLLPVCRFVKHVLLFEFSLSDVYKAPRIIFFFILEVLFEMTFVPTMMRIELICAETFMTRSCKNRLSKNWLSKSWPSNKMVRSRTNKRCENPPRWTYCETPELGADLFATKALIVYILGISRSIHSSLSTAPVNRLTATKTSSRCNFEAAVTRNNDPGWK